jgi:hypothetical protein
MLASTMPLDGIGNVVGAPKPLDIFPAGAKLFGAVNTSVCLTGKLYA